MPGQVLFDLALGLDDKAQADRVAQASCSQADAKRAGVPQRVEQTGVRTQLAQPLLRPGQVVGFLARGLVHLLAQVLGARRECLRLVQRLRADFTHVVDTHQRAGFTALRGVERTVLDCGGRAGARGMHGAGKRAQCIVQTDQDPVGVIHEAPE